jgi:hypothetical protein
MDMIVLCRCGHPSALHTGNGCRAGRYKPCPCLFDSSAAIEAAVIAARAPRWRGVAEPQRSDLHK